MHYSISLSYRYAMQILGTIPTILYNTMQGNTIQTTITDRSQISHSNHNSLNTGPGARNHSLPTWLSPIPVLWSYSVPNYVLVIPGAIYPRESTR